MRIERIHADGFGILHDLEVDGLSAGLTVVAGPNGAGKSSLQQLVVRVLFGFPARRDGDDQRHLEPLAGGVHGGTLGLIDASGGRWEVARFKGARGRRALTVTGPDGSTSHDEAALAGLVANLDGDQYRSLFAIDLQELLSAVGLDDQRLRDHLYEQTVLGNLGSFTGAARAARGQADKLLLPNANATLPTVNTARVELRRLQQELRSARSEAGTIGALRRSVDGAEARLEEIRDELAAVDREQARLDRVADAWPAWQDARDARARSAANPGPAMTEQAIADVEGVRRRRDEAGTAITGIERAQQGRDERLATLVVDEAALGVAERVRQLDRAAAAVPALLDDLAAARDRESAARDEADRAILGAGAAWDDAAVLAVAVDGAARRRLTAAVEAVADAATAHAAALTEHRRTTERVAQERESVARRAADLGERPDADRLRQVGTALHVLDTSLQPVVQARLVAEQRRAQDVGDPAGAAVPLWLAPVLLALAVLVAASVLRLDAPVSVVAALLALVPAVAGGLALARRRSTSAGGTEAPAAVTGPELAAAERAVAQACVTLGIGQPDHAAVAAAADQHAALVRAAERWDGEHASIERDRQALDRADAALEAAAGRVASAGTELDLARDVARRTAVEVGFGDAPDRLEDLPELHRWVTDARGALDRLRDAAEDARRLEDRLAALVAEASDVAARLGRPPITPDTLVARVGVMLASVEAAEAVDAERGGLTAAAREDDATLAARRQEHAAALEELEALYAGHGVTDDDAWDLAVEAATVRRDADHDVEEAERRVRDLIGDDPVGRGLLAAGDPAGWLDPVAALARRREQLEEERTELGDRRGRDRERFERLGGDDTIARLEQDLADQRLVVREATRRWAVLRLAEELLLAARRRYEAEQQPKVLADAGALLRGFTVGALRGVDLGEAGGVVALDATGDRVDPVDLSTGERMQLYLALRVALADNLAGRLPLLLDDVLVGADDDRADAIVRTLATLAQDRQVILFTPSERTRTAAVAAVDGVAVVRLSQGRVIRADEPVG